MKKYTTGILIVLFLASALTPLLPSESAYNDKTSQITVTITLTQYAWTTTIVDSGAKWAYLNSAELTNTTDSQGGISYSQDMGYNITSGSSVSTSSDQILQTDQ